MPPIVRIDPASDAPAYRQVVDQIRTLIVEGGLAEGAELPSVRRLAVDLGVHFNTVAEAYRTLAEEGWLEVAHGRAARVRQRAPASKPEKKAEARFRQRLRNLVAEMRAAGFSVADVERVLAATQKGESK